MKILIEIDPELQRVVPVDPTDKMIRAMEDQWMRGSSMDMAKREYTKMLSAAPQPDPVDADLRRDAERLDYLQKNGSTVCLFGKNLLFMVGGLTSTRSSSIRKSIDSAMSQGEQK